MTDDTKATISSAVKTTKLHIWKYFGAMFMETKDGEKAVSFTRVIALVLFIMLAWKWSGWSAHPDVPEYMIYTFWSLVGVKSVMTAFDKFKGPDANG